jgi:hypothetical protein
MRKTSDTKYTRDAHGESHEIQIVQHPGEEGWNLFLDIVEVSGEAFGDLVEGARRYLLELRGYEGEIEGLEDAEVDLTMIGQGFARLAAGLMRRKDGTSLLKRLFRHTIRDGKTFSGGAATASDHWTINQAFQGNYQEMIQIAALVLTENYGNLFNGLPLAGEAEQPKDRKTPA